MKPFNLEKALAGDPVVTRDGKPVTDFHYFKTADTEQQFMAVVDKIVKSFTTDGKYWADKSESIYDLFMAPIKNVGWVPRQHIRSERTGSDYIKIEWEE